MIKWMWSVFIGGCNHKWEMDGYISGTYVQHRRPYIVNKMKCGKCGMLKLVEKSV